MTQELNLDYANSLRLKLPAYEQALIVLIGCGGTGSWLAPAAARVTRLLQERFDKRVRLVFIDPDQVEEKNVYRQNFCAAEIGRNKAVTLAERYGTAWGIEIEAQAAAYTSGWLGHVHSSSEQLVLLIGCVDNTNARMEIHKSIDTIWVSPWWLDSGNERNSGQVLLGAKKRPGDPFSLPGFCSWLPLPSEQAPELIEPARLTKKKAEDAGLSCADMALRDSQGLAINQRMAAEAADYLVRMLITQDLRKMATSIDLESGSCRSRHITRENVPMETEGERK